MDEALTAVKDYEDLAMAESKRMHRRLDGALELEELLAMANEAVLVAARRIDKERSRAERRSYVRQRVRGHLCDSIGDLYNLPRRAWRHHRRSGLVGQCVRDPTAIDADYWTPCRTMQPHVDITSGIDACRASRALNLLPERSAELIFRVYYEGRSLADAAFVMGMSPSWASRLRREAFAFIRKSLLGESPQMQLQHLSSTGNG